MTDSKDVEFTGEFTITNINENLMESITNIEKYLETLATSSIGNDVVSWVIPAFAGAFSAYLFNLFHWWMVEKKQANSKLNNSLYEIIKTLEDISIQYWLTETNKNNHIENKHLELSIKSHLTIMRKNIKSITCRLEKKIINKNHSNEIISKLKEFESEIFDVITGGEFESSGRTISNSRAAKISSECAEIRAFLSSLEHS